MRPNFLLRMRERGKIVPGSTREGHNVFTDSGRHWLSQLLVWSSLGSVDSAFTNNRLRWIGMGSGRYPEVQSVSSLSSPVLVGGTPGPTYLVPLKIVSRPTVTSLFIQHEFLYDELLTEISEAGLFVGASPTGLDYVNPLVSTNAPVLYKQFEPQVKTFAFTLEVQWRLSF